MDRRRTFMQRDVGVIAKKFRVGLALGVMLSWTCTSLQLTSPLQTINDSCPPELCTRIANKLVCRDCIPDNVPNDTEVNLVAIDPFKLVPGRFCNVHWPTVDALSITTADNKYFSLENGTFDCLQHIRSFRMSSPYLDNFDTGTFNGLKNLTEFDLSGCNRMSLVDLRETFSAPENFPSISRIILSSVCFVYPFGIGQEFIDALASKPISYVDLSHNNFQFQFATSGNLCTTLDTLRIRNAEFYCDSKCQEHPKCKSLRVYDMSGTVDFFERMTCRNTSFTYTVHPFFQEARILMSNEVIKEPLETGSVVNCSLRLLYNTQVEEYHFAGNNLPSFEFKFVNNRFKFLNLSHNRIRSINPDTIKHLSSLAILDLSDNYLAQAQEFQGSVSTFFTHSPQLSELDLSMNNLGRLPKDIFISNTFLKVLNLSHNAFDQIHFHFWNLPNLTTLDLSLNRVESFDPQSRRSLDDWYNFHLDRNDSVSILLDGNPFSCACTSVDFIEWFVASPIFASNASGYQCHVDEMYFPMTHAAMDAAHDDCDKTRRKRLQVILSSVLAPVSILIVAVATALLYRKYRKNKEDRLLNDRILLLKRNEAGRKFAVFLSHSSDENEFVREEILKPLQAGLRKFTKIDRDLVCHADRHFVPGRTIMREMFRCLEDCPVFIAVVSESFCASRYCQHEIETAHTDGKPIILIFKEHVPEDRMDQVTRKIFSNFTRVKCVFHENGMELQPSWDQLCKAILELIVE